MGPTLIVALITTILSGIATKIAFERLKTWAYENRHKIKWEIIYTIFGPDPNKPVVPVPPAPPRRRPIRDWWNNRFGRKTYANPFHDTVPVYALAPSQAERFTGWWFHVSVGLGVGLIFRLFS